jgi:hypothetical protein
VRWLPKCWLVAFCAENTLLGGDLAGDLADVSSAGFELLWGSLGVGLTAPLQADGTDCRWLCFTCVPTVPVVMNTFGMCKEGFVPSVQGSVFDLFDLPCARDMELPASVLQLGAGLPVLCVVQPCCCPSRVQGYHTWYREVAGYRSGVVASHSRRTAMHGIQVGLLPCGLLYCSASVCELSLNVLPMGPLLHRPRAEQFLCLQSTPAYDPLS